MKLPAAGLGLLLLTAIAPVSAAEPSYRIVTRLAPGGDGGWDYLTVDPDGHRLFVSRSTRVQVIDLSTGKLVGEIPGTEGVHGVALAPEVGTGFTSNGRAGTVTAFDLKTLAPVATIDVGGKNPDAILREPVTNRVFTFNGGSGDATAIDAASRKVAGRIALPGRPEFAVADGTGRIFVNLEDRSAIAELDARALKLEATWPLAPCEEPTGLALDREHHRLFAGCGNRLMAVVDSASGKVVTTLPIGAGVDGTAFDPGRGLAFSSNGSGTLTIVREEGPDRFTVVADLPTQRGARTIALDPATHRLYLPTAEFGPAPAPTPGSPRPRPPIVPGSFVVLVVEPTP